MAQSIESVREALTDFSDPELSIIKLSEPISTINAPILSPAHKARASDVSSDAFDNPSPASLSEDLSHYKELFSKLRFSYLEQVTKEKFLRAIVGESPQLILPSTNSTLEAELSLIKADLKSQKENVATLVEALEIQGRELSTRYRDIQTQRAQLDSIPSEIEGLEGAITALKADRTERSTDPILALPLPAIHARVAEREAELEALNAQIASLQADLPRKTRDLERLENEIRPLGVQRSDLVSRAMEARRRKVDGGGMGDEVELQGRWLRAVEGGLRGLLEVGG
ncbi:hypothetical protein MMC09_003028 [Bachmanniomyces sp. S44760]|nr:hypothetical protein [Bachmanniomyces sp. S44760]